MKCWDRRWPPRHRNFGAACQALPHEKFISAEKSHIPVEDPAAKVLQKQYGLERENNLWATEENPLPAHPTDNDALKEAISNWCSPGAGSCDQCLDPIDFRPESDGLRLSWGHRPRRIDPRPK
jgi:hypothetical protein